MIFPVGKKLWLYQRSYIKAQSGKEVQKVHKDNDEKHLGDLDLPWGHIGWGSAGPCACRLFALHLVKALGRFPQVEHDYDGGGYHYGAERCWIEDPQKFVDLWNEFVICMKQFAQLYAGHACIVGRVEIVVDCVCKEHGGEGTKHQQRYPDHESRGKCRSNQRFHFERYAHA